MSTAINSHPSPPQVATYHYEIKEMREGQAGSTEVVVLPQVCSAHQPQGDGSDDSQGRSKDQGEPGSHVAPVMEWKVRGFVILCVHTVCQGRAAACINFFVLTLAWPCTWCLDSHFLVLFAAPFL